MAIFYVYEHWRPDTNVCFYVGKGMRKRAYEIKREYNPKYTRIIDKLRSLGLTIEVKFIASNLEEKDAFRIEVDRITLWRTLGVDLANLTDGGEGVSGCIMGPPS